MTSDRDETAGGEHFQLTDEQAAALALDRNIAITAGAGTGKTTTLTERYITILEANEGCTPENIVTITFTRKAAAELRTRVRTEVYRRLANASTDAEYTRWREILDSLDDGYIHTIHAFCARLLREHAMQAPVPLEFDVLDEDDAAYLQRETIVTYLEDNADTDAIQQLSQLFGSRSTLINVLSGLLAARPATEAWLTEWRSKTPEEYEAFLWEHACDLTAAQAKSVVDHPDVRAAVDDIASLVDQPLDVEPAASGVDVMEAITDVHSEFTDADGDHSVQRYCRALYECLETSTGGLYASASHYLVGPKAAWNSETEGYTRCKRALNTLLEELEKFEDEIATAPSPRVQTSAQYLPALAHTVADLLAVYETEKQEREALDYPDLIETTTTFLENTPSVRTDLAASFTSIMVDEFQDTDPRQWELVRLLTALSDWSTPADNVFLVGDEKQSIYGFRGADVTTFEHARGELTLQNQVLDRNSVVHPALDGAPTELELSGNFRTAENTLAFLNAVFQDVFAPEGRTHEPYEAPPQDLTYERDTVIADRIEGQVEYLAVPDDDGDAAALLGDTHHVTTGATEHLVEAEARGLASRLAALLNDPPLVHDESVNEARRATPEDIAILLRRRTHLDRFQRALSACDIPYTVISGRGFYDTPEVRALINLLRVMADPADTISLYGVLRSPLFGFADTRLATLANDRDTTLWNALSTTDDPPLSEAYTLLQEWRAQAGCTTTGDETAIPWNQVLTHVFEATGYLASIAADERGTQAVANVEKFRDEIRTWAEDGIRTPASLLRRIDRQAELDPQEGEAEIPSGANGVRIMTVHTAKGQEFPIVAVPDIGTKLNYGGGIDDNGWVQLVTDHDEPPFLALAGPNPSDPFTVDTTVAHEYADAISRPRERAEARRVLYVACTRVRDHLILSGTHTITPRDDEDAIAFGETNAPTDAVRWRDWVQPQLLESETITQQLAADTPVTTSIGDATYTVRLPPEETVWEGRDHVDEAYPEREMAPPPAVSQRRRLSPTQLVQVGYEGTDPEAGVTFTEGDDTTELERRHFGTIVHKVAELEPAPEAIETVIRRIAGTMGIDLTPETVDEVTTHVEDALLFLEDQRTRYPDGEMYKEPTVSVEVDDATIVGDIDHLRVTPDTFIVTDYKTNTLSYNSPAENAKHYRPQMMCYALALHGLDSKRDIHINLRFTEAGVTESMIWEPTDIPEIRDEIRALMQQLE